MSRKWFDPAIRSSPFSTTQNGKRGVKWSAQKSYIQEMRVLPISDTAQFLHPTFFRGKKNLEKSCSTLSKRLHYGQFPSTLWHPSFLLNNLYLMAEIHMVQCSLNIRVSVSQSQKKLKLSQKLPSFTYETSPFLPCLRLGVRISRKGSQITKWFPWYAKFQLKAEV